jgi:hypothetical protein
MKNSVRFVVAGLLLAGFATAQAQVKTPESGSSDLWVFVSNQAAHTSFAEDTGIALSSLMPSGQLAASGSTTVLSTAISANFTVGATQALTNYIAAANAAGQTLEWGVLGAQFPTSTATANIKAPGADLTVFDAAASAGANIGNNYGLSTIATIGSAFDNDVKYLAPTYTAGGSSYAFSAGNSQTNVWGAGGDTANGGSTNLYNQNPAQDNVGLDSSVSLYGLTGNGDKTSVQSYILGTNLTLSSAGVLSIGSSPVPLPAAVWLFGSGLLGLIGVGRRKVAA